MHKSSLRNTLGLLQALFCDPQKHPIIVIPIRDHTQTTSTVGLCNHHIITSGAQTHLVDLIHTVPQKRNLDISK